MVRTIRALLIQSSAQERHQASFAFQKIQRFGITIETVIAEDKPDLSDIDAVPDVIILDANKDDDREQMARYADQLRKSQPVQNLLVLVFGPTECFAKFNVDGFLDNRTPANVLARKIKHAIRISSIKVEYQQRFKTMSSFGLETQKLGNFEKAGSNRLLVVGKGERYFELAGLFNGNAQLKAISSFSDARYELENANHDCLVIDSVYAPDLTASEFKDFKFNAKFFNLPVVILQEGLDKDEQVTFLETGGCDLFDLNPTATEIVAHVKTAVEAEFAREQLLDAFGSAAFLPIRDDITGLPNLAFFEKHLERLASQSSSWNQPLTFGVFQVSSIIDIEAPLVEAVKDALMRQVGQTIYSLMRAEDLATYLGDGRFVVATPNTSGLSISSLISRIGSIIRMTEFQVGKDTSRIDVDSHYFDNSSVKSAPEIMERLYA